MDQLDQPLSIRDMQCAAFANSVNKGFYECGQCDGEIFINGVACPACDGKGTQTRNIPEMIALMHSELSEALEDYRDNFPPEITRYEASGKPVGFGIELADCIIRIADTAHYLGVNLERCIREKMAYNKTRPHRHGGKRA